MEQRMEQKHNPEDMGEIKEQNSNIVGQIIGFLKGVSSFNGKNQPKTLDYV